MSIFILLFALALWGIVHSILASNFAKDYAAWPWCGFLPPWLQYLCSDQLFSHFIFDGNFARSTGFIKSHPRGSLLMLGGQVFALLMLFIAFLQTDSLSFVGLRQLFEEEKSGGLVTRGLYRIVRHPLYTFGLLFIWLSPTVSQNSLTVYIGATIYTF